MSQSGSVLRPVPGPRWTRTRLHAMLLDCYGPTPRGAVDVAAVARYAGVSPSTVRRWLSKPPAGTRRPVIPKGRLVQLQRGPQEVERRNEQQYQHALNATASILDDRSILPEWRKQGWLDQHTVAIIAVHGRPWHQVAVTNGTRRALEQLHRRGATVDNLIVPTRFHAQLLMHTVMVRQQAWRVYPVAHRLSVGRTQAWMDAAPAVDLAALAAAMQVRIAHGVASDG